MKCPKCNAENISEAVKCGVCGTRLKHVKINNDFTGASHVQSSVQRQHSISNTSQSNKNNKPQRPKQSDLANSTAVLNNQPSGEAAGGLTDQLKTIMQKWRDIYQEEYQKRVPDESPSPKAKKISYLPLMIFVIAFLGPFLTFVTGTAIPYVMEKVQGNPEAVPAEYAEAVTAVTEDADVVVDAAVPVEAMTTEEDAYMTAMQAVDAAEATVIAASEGHSSKVQPAQMKARYADAMLIQKSMSRFYQTYQRFPQDLSELYRVDSKIRAVAKNNFKVNVKGTISAIFQADHNARLIFTVKSSTGDPLQWKCDSMNLPENVLKKCESVWGREAVVPRDNLRSRNSL